MLLFDENHKIVQIEKPMIKSMTKQSMNFSNKWYQTYLTGHKLRKMKTQRQRYYQES